MNLFHSFFRRSTQTAARYSARMHAARISSISRLNLTHIKAAGRAADSDSTNEVFESRALGRSTGASMRNGKAMKQFFWIASATVLMLAAQNLPAAAQQDCSTFQKAVTDAMAASDDLDAQTKRFKLTSDTPKYDFDVCRAVTKLRDLANTAVTAASAACDPNNLAGNVKTLGDTAATEIPLYCTREAPPAKPQGTAAGDFIFPDSDRRILTHGEISRLSLDELRIARNEIFARRGRYFKSEELTRHFSAFAWYHPNSWNPPLNAIERQNAKMLLNAEQHR
jgi:hypothetical protein